MIDYTWFGERYPDLAEASCFTLVQGLSPDEVLSRLRADPVAHRVTGVGELNDLAKERFEDGRTFMGVTTVDDWALCIEPNGYAGSLENVAVALSAGTRMVAHFRNINAEAIFIWAEDGDIRLTFDPMFPDEREGSEPDALVDVMRDMGFALDGEEDDDESDAALFSLAQHLTNVRLSPELLDNAVFTPASITP